MAPRLAVATLALTTLVACSSSQRQPGSSTPVAATAPAACATASPTPAPATELIPRRVLFGNPERTSVRLSRDGKYLSFLAEVDGVLNIWVGPKDAPQRARPITSDKHSGIQSYAWSYLPDTLLYEQDNNGDENWRLYAVDVGSGAVRDLTPFDGAQVRIRRLSPDHPRQVVVALNQRDPKYHDLYLLDIITGERKELERNLWQLSDFVVDREFKVQYATRFDADGGRSLLRRRPHSNSNGPTANAPLTGSPSKTTSQPPYQVWRTASPEDIFTSYPLHIDDDGALYLIDSTRSDTAALYRSKDYQTVELLAQNPLSDVQDTVEHPSTGEVQSVIFEHVRYQYAHLSPSFAAQFENMQASLPPGDVRILSRTLDDRYWVVIHFDDVKPGEYYLYDTTTQQLTHLFPQRPELSEYRTHPMRGVQITARDGLNLVSYLTLPASSADGSNGKPSAPLPLVLQVHGGPWGRDSYGFNPTHQWLADRGYAVLSVNFRGSAGFGKKFIKAGDLQWGAKMQDDLLDAVNWAVEQGIADPKRIAISGGSYGGYATLAGLTFTPDTYACGVDWYGISNLRTFLDNAPAYWQRIMPVLTSRLGDPNTEAGLALLRERSPLHQADRINKPLLVAQGSNDVRVTQAESDQLVAAVQRNGTPVTYLLYPDEGHGFRRAGNALSSRAITEAFLAQCLGGALEPLGSDLDDTSLSVPAGANHITGLTEALGPRRVQAELTP